MFKDDMIPSAEYIFAHQPIVRASNTNDVFAHELFLRRFNEFSNVNFLNTPSMFVTNLIELAKCKAQTLRSLKLSGELKTVFINFTPDQIGSPLFLEALNTFYEYGLTPSCIAIEVTEQDYAEDTVLFYENLKFARDTGHAIVVDDFGSGIANFNHVLDLKPSIVKLVKELLRRAVVDNFSKRFLKSLVVFLHEIGCKVILEGVENEQFLETAAFCDVDLMQGYHFGMPKNIASLQVKSVDINAMIGKRFKLLA